MKKILLSAIVFMMSAVLALGCSLMKQSVLESAEIQTSAESTVLSYVQDNANYSIQDIINLQNFLLVRETPDLSDKDYDLNDDGRWDVFDLCLMKQSYLKNQQKPIENNNDILVAYFSRTGTTEQIAEYIIDLMGADSFEIKAAVPYTDEDINYSNSSCRANKEQNDKSVRPEIAGTIENMDQYDTIFVGYPIWWSQEPRIMDTFLESYDFSDKTVIPFCTSHSSGMSTSESNIKNLGVEYGELLDGRRFSADSTRNDISEWIETLNIRKEREVGMFDFETKTVMLNSGCEMPINGIGTYSLHGDICVNAVKTALKSGVRLIDTASAYGNEEEVGQAIREAIAEGIIKREDIFVTTKIYPGSEMATPEASIQACLDRLNIGYVDMMLLHHPDKNDIKAYKAMEQFVKDGKIRSIGLSNWYVEELTEFLPQITITPALVQNEIHPYYQENDVIPFIQEKGIVVQGWYPLGGRGHTAELLGDSVISQIAKDHGVSSAQVILRWNL